MLYQSISVYIAALLCILFTDKAVSFQFPSSAVRGLKRNQQIVIESQITNRGSKNNRRSTDWQKFRLFSDNKPKITREDEGEYFVSEVN